MRKQVTVFTSRTCGPCAALKPALAELRAEHGFDLTIVEAGANTQHVFMEMGVRAVPTTIAFDGEKELGRFTGAKTKADLAAWLKAYEVI